MRFDFLISKHEIKSSQQSHFNVDSSLGRQQNIGAFSRGFTIIELLVVVVVIGILATIVIVSYEGVNNRAYDATIRSDFANFAKKLQLYRTSNNDLYPTTAQLGNVDLKVSKSAYDVAENNLYYCLNPTTNEYAMAARSKSKKDYKMVNGTVTEAAAKIYGADTCNLVSAPINAQLGWNAATQQWLSWAQ